MKEKYFKDPNGNVWVSEDDYRQYQSQMQTVSETVAVAQGESDTHVHAYGFSEEITEEVTQRRI